MLASSRLALRAAVSVAFGLLAMLAAGSSSAAAYRGFADPLFGATIASVGSGNLAWRLDFTIDIPDAPGCFSINVSPFTACVSGATFTDAKLTFYDFVSKADLATVLWNATELSGVNVAGIQDDGTKPIQLDTGFFPNKLATGLNGFGPADDGPYGNFLDVMWSVGFSFDFQESKVAGPVLRWTGTICTEVQKEEKKKEKKKKEKKTRDEHEVEEQEVESTTTCPPTEGYNDFQEHPPREFSFTEVPEPGTLALIAGSMIAAFGLKRRPSSRK